MWDAGILECISKSKQVQILLNHDINGKGDVNACVQLIHRDKRKNEKKRNWKLSACSAVQFMKLKLQRK